MSWLSYCYKTYQNSVSEIGKQQPGKVPLLPVAHTTQQVNIEVELDKDGNFQYAGSRSKDNDHSLHRGIFGADIRHGAAPASG